MARISTLSISESIEYLTSLLKKETHSKNKDRLRVLIYIKENRFSTREKLSNYLGVTRRTIERWLGRYRKGGIETMLSSNKRNRKSQLITQNIHDALEQRVMDSEQGFSSYIEARRWISSEFDLDLKYNTVREHLIRHFKTKIKSPRKSHVKKDKQAVEAFLKTT